ncbi:MAG TPA: hypothetical protein VFP95_02440 [Gammaproteobacteria bacterium]|nr:hypothetical protein [Gammaproteobacteria bacterium]
MWWYIAAAVAGALLKSYNTNKMLDKKDAATARLIKNQGVWQDKADKKISEKLDDADDNTAKKEQQVAAQQYKNTLASAQPVDKGPKKSSEYAEALAESLAKKQGKIADLTNMMAKVDKIGMDRFSQGLGYANLGSQVNTLSNFARGQRNVDQIKVNSIRRNPWLDFLSAGLQAYGRSGMSGGGG